MKTLSAEAVAPFSNTEQPPKEQAKPGPTAVTPFLEAPAMKTLPGDRAPGRIFVSQGVSGRASRNAVTTLKGQSPPRHGLSGPCPFCQGSTVVFT